MRRSSTALLVLTLAGCTSSANSPETTTTSPAPTTSTTLPPSTTTSTTLPSPKSVPFEVIGFGQSTSALWGQIRYATVDLDLERLWGVFSLPEEPPTIDLDSQMVLFYNRVEDSCPDTLESLELVGDRLEPTFVPPDAGCDLPALAFAYAVSIPRSSLPDEFVAILPAGGSIYPEQQHEVDLTTITTDLGEPLLMGCGRAQAGFRFTAPDPLPLGQEGENALDALSALEEGRFFAETFDWGVWSRTDSRLVLLGRGPSGLGDVSFTPSADGTWLPGGWGDCDWSAGTASQGAAATWIADPDDPPAPDSTTLHLLATERACANGQPPGDREVTHVVVESPTTVTVIVLVERIEGSATCQSNPSFEYTVELDSPLGDRDLVDGSSIPGEIRTP